MEKHQGDKRVTDELNFNIKKKVNFIGSLTKNVDAEYKHDFEGVEIDWGARDVESESDIADWGGDIGKSVFKFYKRCNVENGGYDETLNTESFDNYYLKMNKNAEYQKERQARVARLWKSRRAQCAVKLRKDQEGSKGGECGGSEQEGAGADDVLEPRVGGGEQVLLTMTVPAARRDEAEPEAPVRRRWSYWTDISSQLALRVEGECLVRCSTTAWGAEGACLGQTSHVAPQPLAQVAIIHCDQPVLRASPKRAPLPTPPLPILHGSGAWS